MVRESNIELIKRYQGERQEKMKEEVLRNPIELITKKRNAN